MQKHVAAMSKSGSCRGALCRRVYDRAKMNAKALPCVALLHPIACHAATFDFFSAGGGKGGPSRESSSSGYRSAPQHLMGSEEQGATPQGSRSGMEETRAALKAGMEGMQVALQLAVQNVLTMEFIVKEAEASESGNVGETLNNLHEKNRLIARLVGESEIVIERALQCCAVKVSKRAVPLQTLASATPSGDLAQELLDIIGVHQQLLRLAVGANFYTLRQYGPHCAKGPASSEALLLEKDSARHAEANGCLEEVKATLQRKLATTLTSAKDTRHIMPAVSKELEFT